ncbi:TraA/ATP-dependent exoDNAse/relaxase [Kocuria dechangensis]|uniref:TraA/ATP-dependent exoDNAse/relaxase n=1 Tax=Kocuria dechangensis TaxID=1176249 RepID=A0A917H344_9MICC|nr:MobF family relaxase [Kocuria dechangensis]GGG66043.1 TraA/ATP-dependent exoDNAse/relaxase [Kocuria dechangensis]
MTVHKLSAGDGYAYYTSEVASADELRAEGRELGDYYTVEGMPPGQWVAHSQALLGVAGEVTEAQMAALFGEGIHPEADRILAEGGTQSDVALGQKYRRYTTADTELVRRLGEEIARHERTTGAAPSKEQARAIRGRVGGQLFREMHGRDAKNSSELGRFITAQTTPRQQTVAGYDLVFSPAKSVSLLWALGGEEARKAVEAAHTEAIAETLSFLEREATFTRRGRNGVRQIDVAGGLVATQFRHYDSRTGDPHLHDHVVIANKVKGVDGKWSSLDGRTLYRMGVAASETYNAKVVEKVCAALGVAAVPRAAGGDEPIFEIAGIDLEAIHHASSRRADIAGTLKHLEAEFTQAHGYAPSPKQKIALAQQATLQSRPAKKSARRLSELVEQWGTEYGQQVKMPVGDELLERVRAAATGLPTGPDAAQINVSEHARLVVHELSQKRATWSVNHVHAQTRRHLKQAMIGRTVPDDLVARVVNEATTTHSLAVTPHADVPRLPEFARADGTSQFVRSDAHLYTSREVLAAEHQVLAAAQRTVIPAVSTERFEEVLAAHTGPLSDGQVALARAFACDEKLLALGIGPAGAGKTTSLSLAADAVRATGGTVVGLAPTAAAAAVMAGDIGAQATTIDAFLIAHRTGRTGAVQLHAGDVVIVDEVGMVTTPKLAELVTVAARHGAVVRAIGDDRQLGAIGSGGALRLLDAQVGATRLEAVHRFRAPGEAAASLALREPPAVGADTPWAWYMENKRVVAGDTEAMVDAALRAWIADTQAGKRSLLIASDNATVTELNARAQAARVATGTLGATGESVVLRDGLTAHAGDVVVTRRNDRTLALNGGKDFVKNNDVWAVEHVGADTATLRHTGHGGKITLDAEYLAAHGQLGYAATVHRAQGATVDTAHAILDAATDRAAAYVAATRGRETNQLYVALADGETRDEALATIAGAYDRNLSAHETVAAEAMRNGDVATLAGVYRETHDAAWTAKTRTMAVEVLGAEKAAELTGAEAWGAVATHLHTAQDQGLDPAALLSRAVHQRGFGDAADPAAVLAWRLEHQIETARAILDTTDRRPLGNLTDAHLARLADRTRALQDQVLEDPQWATHPFALMSSAELDETLRLGLAQLEAMPPERWTSTTAAKLDWMTRTMSAEQERRAGLSPAQAGLEQIARGERTRSDSSVSIGEAIAAEQQVRAVAAKTPPPRPVADGRRVSEDLAPTPLMNDPQVPTEYREQLERLRTRIEQRVMVRGAELAETRPEWTAALGPVPSKPAKTAEWHQVAAEVEAYRTRYNIGAHETALIPKAHRQDPVAATLIARATALHKHSMLTTAAPQTPAQIRQAVDEAHVAERVRAVPPQAQEVLEALRAARGQAADPLPHTQARAAAVTEAAKAVTAQTPERPLSTDELIARAVARHRATTQQAGPATGTSTSHEPATPAPTPKKEPEVSESTEQSRQQASGPSWRAQHAQVAKRLKAAERTEQTVKCQEDRAAATRRAADRTRRDDGRSL